LKKKQKPPPTLAVNQDDSQNEEIAVSLFKHVKEIAQMKYDNELRREDSLIQQSGHMQTAFSFMTAALFMAAPVIVDNRGKLSFCFLLAVFSTIVAALLASLILASLVQWRYKKKDIDNVSEIEKDVAKNWEYSKTEAQQLKRWVMLMGELQQSKAVLNERRVKFIMASMISFFVSIAFVIIWFIIAMIIIQ
jgi:Flp pilus assembly protein TadB